jgi:hypothetical protein
MISVNVFGFFFSIYIDDARTHAYQIYKWLYLFKRIYILYYIFTISKCVLLYWCDRVAGFYKLREMDEVIHNFKCVGDLPLLLLS